MVKLNVVKAPVLQPCIGLRRSHHVHGDPIYRHELPHFITSYGVVLPTDLFYAYLIINQFLFMFLIDPVRTLNRSFFSSRLMGSLFYLQI